MFFLPWTIVWTTVTDTITVDYLSTFSIALSFIYHGLRHYNRKTSYPLRRQLEIEQSVIQLLTWLFVDMLADLNGYLAELHKETPKYLNGAE